MAIDDAAKRMSAIFPGSVWRGAYVQVDLPFAQRHRQAAAYLYSGILAGGASPTAANMPVQRLSIGLTLTIRGGL